MVRQRNKGQPLRKPPKLSKLHNKEKQDSFSISQHFWIALSILFGLLLIAVVLVINYKTNATGTPWETVWEEVNITVESHQKFSLRKPYDVDYEQILRIRKKNMEKYAYDYDVFGVDKRSNLSVEEFRDVYDGKWPVVVTDVVTNWKAANWSGKMFNEKYGEARTTMKAVNKGLSNAESLALPLKLFYQNTKKAYPDSWTYIEDELFIPMRPELKEQIGQNIYTEEDYFTLFPEDVRPWNCMLLWGTKYSRSSLHIDPYNWTGTNAVFMGRKRWKLYPPGQDDKLYVREGIMSGFPLDCYKYNSVIDTVEPDHQYYPKFQKAAAIEFDQLPGEILFIPTGWFHQAYNVEETLAVSGQITNRNNYRIVLEEVIKAGNIDRKDLPANIDDLSPVKQVQAVMSLLPSHLLERGKAVTADAIEQVQNVDQKLGNYKPRTP